MLTCIFSRSEGTFLDAMVDMCLFCLELLEYIATPEGLSGSYD
jgi:hypothetical protein